MIQLLLLSAVLAATPGHSYREAYQQAKREHKPLLVYVGAEWCAPCHQMKKKLSKLARSAQLTGYAIAIVDADKDHDATEALAVPALPTLIIFDERGKRSLVGDQTESEIKTFMDKTKGGVK